MHIVLNSGGKSNAQSSWGMTIKPILNEIPYKDKLWQWYIETSI